MKYLLPQEIQVWYILPAIRKELTKVLVKEQGLTQKETAKILSITEAAVSQYLSEKRANTIKLDEYVINEIRKSAIHIYKHPKCIISEIVRILDLKETWKSICEFHKENDPNINLKCNICKKSH
jgi:uncharacterized protein